MNFIEWSDDVLVNVQKVDEQHKEMARILNALFQTLGSGRDIQAKALMNELELEVKTHFETEEELMKNYKYLNFFSHKLEHDRFLNKVIKLNEAIQTDNEIVNLEMLKSFKNWFFNHIDINDKKMGDYLALKGVDVKTHKENIKI